MFKKFFNGGYVTEENGVAPGRKRRGIIVFAVVIAVLMLALGGKGGETPKLDDAERSERNVNIGEYTKETEERLRNILSKIGGAGTVEVMVTFDTIYERVPAKNEKTDTARSADGDKTSDSGKTESSIQVFGSGSSQQPYLLKEKLPMPSGVAVAASGAGDERVKLEIYEAVKALYGISGNRIKVAAGNKINNK